MPPLMYWMHEDMVPKNDLHLSAEQIGNVTAAIRDVD